MRYAPYLEFGTKSHYVSPRNRKALRWIARGRGYAFSKGHTVSGIKARRFFFAVIERAMRGLPLLIQQFCMRHLTAKA